MAKTVEFTRWAVHKRGTEQLGYLCSFKPEAEDMLRDLQSSIINMPAEEKAKYEVVEVKVQIIEPEEREDDEA